MTTRVAVFIDYHNAYRGARRAFFHEWDPGVLGHVQPRLLALKLKGRSQDVNRPLNYRDPHDPREKGIDVSLAVDFVMMAQRGEYDIGILFSEDTDLIPALEAVAELRGPSACETGTWHPLDEPGRLAPKPLLLPHARLGAVHLLRKGDFDHVSDTTDYNVRRRRR